MGRKWRASGIAVVAALSIATTVTTTQSAAAEPVAAVEWGLCEKPEDGVQCGTLEVPVDYDDPDGETIEIGLAKRAATDPGARVGSLLTTGVDTVTGPPFGSDRLREKFDLIGFDPRGFKTSTNIQCDPDDLAAVHRIGVPTDRASFAKRAKANNRLADGCRKLTGPLFEHADNLHIVEDIESIREAIGGGRLNFLGSSHGTLMGQQYAEKYPKNIRTMALDGNMDHSLDGAWEYAGTETAAVERNFDAFAKWCDETADCALYGQDTSEVYGELRDRARAGELTDPGSGDLIGFHAFAQRTLPVNQPQAWRDLAADLKSLRDGEGSLKVVAASELEPAVYAMQSICSNWDVSVDSFREWDAMSRRLAREYPDTQWSPFVDHLATCVGDPVETTNPQAPLDIEGAPPLVMVGNRNDFATVYQWSQTAAEQSGATLITYEGYGHTIFGVGNECVDEPVETYLVDGTVPDAGISCESRDKP